MEKCNFECTNSSPSCDFCDICYCYGECEYCVHEFNENYSACVDCIFKPADK